MCVEKERLLFKKPGVNVFGVEPVGVVGRWTGVDCGRLLVSCRGAGAEEGGEDVGGEC